MWSVANGKNVYPIGLITAQEANLCGLSTGASDYPWLYTNNTYWTMSRHSVDSRIWYVDGGRKLIYGVYSAGSYFYGVDSAYKVRPVISLSNMVRIEDGDGSANNPYIISMG